MKKLHDVKFQAAANELIVETTIVTYKSTTFTFDSDLDGVKVNHTKQHAKYLKSKGH